MTEGRHDSKSHRAGDLRCKRDEFEDIAERLQARREARGQTQEEAADEIGVDQSALSRWEAGLRTPKTVLARRALRAYLAGEADGD